MMAANLSIKKFMPSGRTHDQITLWSLPVVGGFVLALSKSSNFTLLVCGGFLFSGLMFGPDLDIRSHQFRRWGWLRWLWLPYQKSVPHRSLLSHGPVIGTTLRLAFLGTWAGLLTILGLFLAGQFWEVTWSWQMISTGIGRSLNQHRKAWLALWVGLELGAMSHSLSDWGSSCYQRRFRK